MILETERLRLRMLSELDATSLYELDRDSEVMRFIGPHALESPSAYAVQILEWLHRDDDRDGERLFLAIELRESCEWLGWLHLRPALDFRYAREAGYQAGEHDLGYRLRRVAWGKGFATEAAGQLIHHEITVGRVRRVVSSALIGNSASIRVMEKIGLNRESYFQLPGYDQVSVRYGYGK
jgi:RimJ/RimL family protein N-acetyltransferase